MDADLTLRSLREGEFADWIRFVERGFLEAEQTATDERWQALCRPLERFHAVVDADGAYVGSSGAFPFRMSVPGGDSLGCAGVTVITVRTDRRRRGVLRAMMRRCMDDAIANGEPLAALYASEGTIYGRFGFGVAAEHVRLTVERQHALPVPPGDPANVRLVSAEEAVVACAPVYEAHRAGRGGMMARDGQWWPAWLLHDHESERDGWTARFHAVVPGRGYAIYRGKDDWADDRLPDGRLRVLELVANDPEAYADLWTHLASVDLVREITAPGRPVDDPLRFLVADEGRVLDRSAAPLYLRLVDLPTALASRAYDATDHVAVEVTDAFLPDNAGRWLLDVTPDGAACSRTDRAPDLELDTVELASVYLGGVRATRLRDAGRIREHVPGACARLDRMVHVAAAPWSAFDF